MPPLRQAYRLMHGARGHLQWWPADSPFEICVGAILTQNTSWKNVELAITNLKAVRVLTPKKIHALTHSKLAQLIRPSGYFNIKAKRLRNFVDIVVEQHGASLKRFFKGDTATVRERLLAINGVAPKRPTACCSTLEVIKVLSSMPTRSAFSNATIGATPMRITMHCKRSAQIR